MLSPQTQPQLDLFTVVTDRKIYRPDDKIVLFAVAPDLAGMAVDLEIRFQGQKVYEAQLELNDDGLGLHQYDDLHEGEYSIVLSDPQSPQRRAEAVFTVAECTLSPLIATLVEHQFADRVLSFKFDVRLLSAPYSGPLQLGLQSQASGDQIVATQQVEVVSGLLSGQFDVTRHGGPFHVQLTTPDGNTAQVDFPGTGFRERRSLPLNPLGQGVELSLLPGEATTPVRGFYLGDKGVSVTPLVLKAVHSSTGRLQIAKALDQLQLVLFDPRRRTSQTLERTNLKKGDVVEFEVAAPYTLFTAGAFLTGQPQPFEGWGIVIPPVNFEATLTAPQTAQPGETIEVEVAAVTHTGEPAPVFCWLLVYDARLEHESPIPKLAKQIYQSIQAASQQLQADAIKSVSENPFGYQFGDELFLRRTSIMPMAMPTGAIRFAAAAMSEPVAAGMAQIPAAETATLIETPARMEFPELAYQELFFIGGQTGRTIQLGDQIGLWRVRAYLFRGADYRELTVDVQADKRLYAELNLPAIASDGDRIMPTYI
jgi:hypothetical protein